MNSLFMQRTISRRRCTPLSTGERPHQDLKKDEKKKDGNGSPCPFQEYSPCGLAPGSGKFRIKGGKKVN